LRAVLPPDVAAVTPGKPAAGGPGVDQLRCKSGNDADC
jgi:hypothetical protein